MSSIYDTSDEDDIDDFYSDPVVKKFEATYSPIIQSKEIRDELLLVMEQSKKIDLFMKSIHDDISGDNISVLMKLLSLGVPVDSSNDPLQWTPLMKACSMGKSEIVQFLLEQGADPNLHRELFTPLMASCNTTYLIEENRVNCVRLLLQYNADVNATDKYRTTALMYAIQSRCSGVVELLLATPNLNVNIQDREGLSALFYAVTTNNPELVMQLIAAGSDTTLTDRYGRTALDVALFKEFEDIATLLGYNRVEKTDPVEPERDMSTDFLRELPNADGSGGFPSDIKTIIESKSVIKLQNNISLSEFLNATEDDLIHFGIPFKYDRMKLLKCTIHEYHLCSWKKSSMPSLSLENTKITDVVKITSSILKHLTIANASLQYLKTRVLSRLDCKLEDLTLQQELISIFLNIYSTVKQLRKMLQDVLKHCKQVEICTPDDFIKFGDGNAERRKSFFQKSIHYSMGAAAMTGIGLIILRRTLNLTHHNFLV